MLVRLGRLTQVQAKLLVEQNTVQSLTAHYEDLKSAQDHLANSYSQQQATITRLREDLDKVRAVCWRISMHAGHVIVVVGTVWTGLFQACLTFGARTPFVFFVQHARHAAEGEKFCFNGLFVMCDPIYTLCRPLSKAPSCRACTKPPGGTRWCQTHSSRWSAQRGRSLMRRFARCRRTRRRQSLRWWRRPACWRVSARLQQSASSNSR